jgi:hypothetical protein
MRRLSSVGLQQTIEPLHVEPCDGMMNLVGFGCFVLLAKNNGTRLVVGTGAPICGDGGAVFVYDYDGTGWVEPTTMILGVIGDRIGNRISLSADGGVLAVRFKTMVRIFHLDTNEVPHDFPGDGSTVSLSYDGKLVAVGAEGFTSFTGRVLLCAQQADSGNYSLLTDAGTPSVGANALSLSHFDYVTLFNEQGNWLAIFAPHHGSGGRLNVGLVRMFESVGESSWIQMGQDTDRTVYWDR